MLCPFCSDDLNKTLPRPPNNKEYIYIMDICGNIPTSNNYIKFHCNYCHRSWFIEIKDVEESK